MKHLMPKSAGNFRGVSHTVTEQVNLPAPDHTGCDRIRNSPDVHFAIANKNGGLMAKLRESFFNYLRNCCL